MKFDDVLDMTDDGDTAETADGTYRLRVEPDECFDIGDIGDTYGRVVWYNERPRTDHGYDMRPDGFDGNAEILSVGRDGRVWWQPPADVPRTDRETFRVIRSALRDLLEFGYSVVTLERLDGTDAYGRPIVRAAASLGGIEPCWSDVWRDMLRGDVLPSLLDELQAEENQENQ